MSFQRPNRRRPGPPGPRAQARPAAPFQPLAALLNEHRQWLASHSGKPPRQALKQHWQELDARHARRPDYLLWRQLPGQGRPPPARQEKNVLELSLRALQASEPEALWAAFALLPGFPAPQETWPLDKKDHFFQTLARRLKDSSRLPLPAPLAGHACALVKWRLHAWTHPLDSSLWTDLETLLTAAEPGWKPGRPLALGFWDESVWPLTAPVMRRSLARQIRHLISLQIQAAPASAGLLLHWHLHAWHLLHEGHSPQDREAALHTLLDAAETARLAADPAQAAQLQALALQFLPPSLDAVLEARCRVAAWQAQEAGFAVPSAFHTPWEDLPFPNDPPSSAGGQKASSYYQDPHGPATARHILQENSRTGEDWAPLREAGIPLHHPLASLMWIARKAQSHALKKQHSLLAAAAVLAEKHHQLTTLARLLPHLPPAPEQVIRFARTLRHARLRHPLLADESAWNTWTQALRLAWARLPADAFPDPEDLFFLHETLHDRDVTQLRALPDDWREPALKHLHARKHPSPLVQKLASTPAQPRLLEHQRQMELWSLATVLRERPEFTGTVLISLVSLGDPSQGRYSLLMLTASGHVHDQGRLSATTDTALDWSHALQKVADRLPAMASEATRLWLASDLTLRDQNWPALAQNAGLPATLPLLEIPSWEWSFRVMRETVPAPQPGQILTSSDKEKETVLPPGFQVPAGLCLLLAKEGCQAATRWFPQFPASAGPDSRSAPPPPRRSYFIGSYPEVRCSGPVSQGPLKDDLIRLSLAQACRRFSAPHSILPTKEKEAEAEFLQSPSPRCRHHGL